MTQRLVAAAFVGIVRLLTGVRARWSGEPPPLDAPCIYFANHSSHLDALVVWAALPGVIRRRTRPVAAADYWQKNALRRYVAGQVFHCVLIERQARAARASIDLMVAALNAGASLIIFPEGTRGGGESLGRFRTGLYHLACARPDVALVPVYLDNLNRVLPKGEFLPVPVLGGASFGSALHLRPDENKNAFCDRARDAVLALSPDPAQHPPPDRNADTGDAAT